MKDLQFHKHVTMNNNKNITFLIHTLKRVFCIGLKTQTLKLHNSCIFNTSTWIKTVLEVFWYRSQSYLPTGNSMFFFKIKEDYNTHYCSRFCTQVKVWLSDKNIIIISLPKGLLNVTKLPFIWFQTLTIKPRLYSTCTKALHRQSSQCIYLVFQVRTIFYRHKYH